MSRTLKEELKFDRSAVTSLDWESYPILTFPEIPEIAYDLIDRPDERPGTDRASSDRATSDDPGPEKTGPEKTGPETPDAEAGGRRGDGDDPGDGDVHGWVRG